MKGFFFVHVKRLLLGVPLFEVLFFVLLCAGALGAVLVYASVALRKMFTE